MNDDELEALIRTAAPRYRVPEDPPLGRIWEGLESRAFGSRVVPLPVRPWLRVVGYAAMLVIGVGLGWTAARSGKGGLDGSVPPGQRTSGQVTLVGAPGEPSPFVGVARDYFQQSTALVVAIAGDLQSGQLAASTVARARDLLSTTRLLLDRNPPDPALRDLLQDLELVLAQVVRLPEVHQPGADGQLIVEAMDQRDVLSRLTTILADREPAP